MLRGWASSPDWQVWRRLLGKMMSKASSPRGLMGHNLTQEWGGMLEVRQAREQGCSRRKALQKQRMEGTGLVCWLQCGLTGLLLFRVILSDRQKKDQTGQHNHEVWSYSLGITVTPIWQKRKQMIREVQLLGRVRAWRKSRLPGLLVLQA